MRASRLGLATIGIAIAWYGVLRMVTSLDTSTLIRLPLWLAGAIAVDDFMLIPLVLLAGWVIPRVVAGNEVARIALICVGVTTLIALPLTYRQGRGANATVLARNYVLDWLLLEAVIVGLALVAVVVRHGRARRR